MENAMKTNGWEITIRKLWMSEPRVWPPGMIGADPDTMMFERVGGHSTRVVSDGKRAPE